MTTLEPLTGQQLAEIATRAARLHECTTLTDEANRLISDDVPALLAEICRLLVDLDAESEDLAGARLSLWEEQQHTARLRAALESARRGRRQLRAQAVQAAEDLANPLPWARVRAIVNRLDATNGTSPHETAMRLLKLVEEAGEVAQAYIGMTGQNPRKGVTHSAGDVAAELCDVILTAMVALHGFTDRPAALLAGIAENRHQRLVTTHAAANGDRR